MQPPLPYLRFIVEGEVANAWAKFGGLGAMLTDLARVAKLSVARNMDTAPTCENARNAAWSHLARRRGNMGFFRGELIWLNRDGFAQRIHGQQSD